MFLVFLASIPTAEKDVGKVENILQKLRAILQESEAKLEMKFLTPLHFLLGGRLPGGGGDEQKQPYLDRQVCRCHGLYFDQKIHSQEVKLNESGSRVHVNQFK